MALLPASCYTAEHLILKFEVLERVVDAPAPTALLPPETGRRIYVALAKGSDVGVLVADFELLPNELEIGLGPDVLSLVSRP